jgi:arginine/lysine/ornithine decarboxylase
MGDQNTTADQAIAPFVEDLTRRIDRPRTSFHMPGHKHDPGSIPALTQLAGGDLVRSDLSEMSGVDYLHAASGPLRQAEGLAASAFGADRTFFLVNGSTGGNHAAMLSAIGDGQKVLLPRASHRSILTALILTNAVPVYISPRYHPVVGLPLAVDLSDAERLAEEHPDIAAIQITSPGYYGFTSDVLGFARLADRMGVPLLVDEAHGSHFSFHPSLPLSALHAGADLVVQSTHKTLGSLTQSSMLHWRHGRVERRRVEEVVAMLQSSSPSVLLTASLDSARLLMATSGPELLTRAVALADQARSAIGNIPGLRCHGSDLLGRAGVHDYDRTKILVRVGDLGLTGYEVAVMLDAEWGIEVEMSDRDHVLFSLTFADTADDVALLVTALTSIASRSPVNGSPHVATFARVPAFPIPERVLGPREAFFAPSQPVGSSEAPGRVCAEWIIPYPPGIPVLAPGEVIDQSTLDGLHAIVADGATIVGAEDQTLGSIRVIAL